MKKGKKMTAVLITVALAFGLCVPALAAEDGGSLDNFKQSVEYPGFTDVAVDSWYYGNVKTAVEYGLMKGTSATAFNPMGNVTIQEAVIMAARLRCIYETGSSVIPNPDTTPFSNEASWATPEFNYLCNATGLLRYDYFNDCTRPITRGEMAHLFEQVAWLCAYADGYGSDADMNIYGNINTIEDGKIPDVTTSGAYSTKYAEKIYKLYGMGVMTGDANHAAAPNANITRAETAAIIGRLAIPAQRVRFDLVNPAMDTSANNYLADGVTKSPYAGHTIYVGTATQTTGGQPRYTSQTGSATSKIATKYGFHNYNSANQSEYDAVIAHMQTAYDKLFVGKGNEALEGACGLNAESWDVVDDIIAGRSFDAKAWSQYLASNFPTLSTSLKTPKEQATALKLYAQYSKLVRNCQAVGGQNTGVSAYDAFFRKNGSCVSSAQVQLLAADMLGIDCTTYAGNDHMFAVLKIQGVYFSGEFEQAYSSLKAGVGDMKQITEWTSASSPLK